MNKVEDELAPIVALVLLYKMFIFLLSSHFPCIILLRDFCKPLLHKAKRQNLTKVSFFRYVGHEICYITSIHK